MNGVCTDLEKVYATCSDLAKVVVCGVHADLASVVVYCVCTGLGGRSACCVCVFPGQRGVFRVCVFCGGKGVSCVLAGRDGSAACPVKDVIGGKVTGVTTFTSWSAGAAFGRVAMDTWDGSSRVVGRLGGLLQNTWVTREFRRPWSPLLVSMVALVTVMVLVCMTVVGWVGEGGPEGDPEGRAGARGSLLGSQQSGVGGWGVTVCLGGPSG